MARSSSMMAAWTLAGRPPTRASTAATPIGSERQTCSGGDSNRGAFKIIIRTASVKSKTVFSRKVFPCRLCSLTNEHARAFYLTTPALHSC
eukprot:513459-Prymnesium_polylepis.1